MHTGIYGKYMFFVQIWDLGLVSVYFLLYNQIISCMYEYIFHK